MLFCEKEGFTPLFKAVNLANRYDLMIVSLALDGNAWAIEHIANRLDGKVREQLELTPNRNLKIRYESYEEARAALLEQGVNIDRLPMLTDMRIPEGRDRS